MLKCSFYMVISTLIFFDRYKNTIVCKGKRSFNSGMFDAPVRRDVIMLNSGQI